MFIICTYTYYIFTRKYSTRQPVHVTVLRQKSASSQPFPLKINLLYLDDPFHFNFCGLPVVDACYPFLQVNSLNIAVNRTSSICWFNKCTQTKIQHALRYHLVLSKLKWHLAIVLKLFTPYHDTQHSLCLCGSWTGGESPCTSPSCIDMAPGDKLPSSTVRGVQSMSAFSLSVGGACSAILRRIWIWPRIACKKGLYPTLKQKKGKKISNQFFILQTPDIQLYNVSISCLSNCPLQLYPPIPSPNPFRVGP